jgi:acyl-CoA synthetase (AMP-forming)/AMP-acid ligase II
MTEYRLLRWLDNPQDKHGIKFARQGDEWEFFSYARLSEYARDYAGQLCAAGLCPGDVVALVYGNSPAFVAAFFGCLMAGGTPAPIAPPGRFHDGPGYLDHVSRLLRLARPRLVSTTARWAPMLSPAAERAGSRIVVPEPGGGGRGPATAAAPAELGLLQFSSGSTGPARAVQVPLAELEVNLDFIECWMGGTAADASASWLPLHHDMGLIGCLLLPVSRGCNVWLMEPEQFVRSPARWLRCFGEYGAAFSAMPNFGLAHVTRRVTAADLDGMRFHGWRALVVGAERVDATAVESFTRLLEPSGFSRRAVLPSYGLAEATLAVAGSRRDEGMLTISVDPATLAPGAQVKLAAEPADRVRIVSCGRPLPRVSVTIIDEEAGPLPEGSVGEITVAGPCVARGCLGPGEDEYQRFDGVVRTGDAGFLLDGQLYVLGRIGDTVKLRGRWLFAEHLEDVVRTVAPSHWRHVTLLGYVHGRETAVVVIEGDVADRAESVGTLVARHADGLRVIVVHARRGSILRTTSGKPRRRALWQRFAAGQLGTAVSWDSQRSPATS